MEKKIDKCERKNRTKLVLTGHLEDMVTHDRGFHCT